MYHFKENNIVTGYIKELLHNFNLPTCEVFVPNRTVVYPETNYIYNNILIKTNSSVSVGTYDELTLDMYTFVMSYVYGCKIPNITKTLKLNTILYDSYTHEYLGNYLRFLRDKKGIDLMMMYNCFSDRLVNNLLYTNKFNAEDPQYKIYAVPIKFDRNYLIGIDSDSEIELVCGLFDDSLQITSIETGDPAKDDNSLFKASYRNISSSQFNNPFEYSVSSVNLVNKEVVKKYESCLKLFIKLPAQNISSISIIEVTGSPSQFKQQIDGGLAEMTITKDGVSEYPTKLSLFKINDNVSYPFATRLLEYLFGQAIAADEQIGENIERVQLQLISPAQYLKNGVRLNRITNFGVWTDTIREVVYQASLKGKSPRELKYIVDGQDVVAKTKFIDNNYDLTGYIDKDVESLITVVAD